MSEPWSIDIDGIRRWRDEYREALGSDPLAPSSSMRTPRGEWYAIDLLLRELDRVQPAIDQMWKDHQCQRPDLEAIVRDLASLDPVGEDYGAGPECVMCAAFKPGPQAIGPPELEDHDEQCPWRRAVEWVRETAAK